MTLRTLCITASIGLALTTGAHAQGVKTVKPGVLTVAIDNDMPYCKEESGKIIGVDGEIITAIATKLGLKVEPAVMEWAAEIQAVQSGRADTNICGMAYTAERAKTVNLSDGAYYQVFPPDRKAGVPRYRQVPSWRA